MITTILVSLPIFLASVLNPPTGYTSTKEELTLPSKATLNFHFHTLNFIKNNEYFNPILEGQTLAGFHLHPILTYTTSENITTELGLFIRRYWAEKNLFSRVAPTFTLKYQKQAARFLIGNLKGGTAHRLIRPLYDPERTLQNLPEIGLQTYYTNKNTFLDIWLDWLTLLDKQNNIPEELVVGLSWEQQLAQISQFTIRIPLQLMLYHLGGQGIPTKDFSLWMGAIGARMNFKFDEPRFLQNICLANYYVANRYLKKVARPFTIGHALFSQITFNTTWFTIQGSYWNSYGFSSENLGHPLYQSMSTLNKQATYQEKYRQLLLLHLEYHYALSRDLELVLQIDPYYDVNGHILEHEAGLYISYKPRFNLASFET